MQTRQGVESRPARARGLKRVYIAEKGYSFKSRPARARGLKPLGSLPRREVALSRPARARGLKLDEDPAKSIEGGRAPRGRVD